MKRITIVILWLMFLRLAAAASPQIKFIGPARNDVLEIVITAGKVNIGKQIHYNKEPDDTIRESGHNRYLFRQGKKIGVLVGKDSGILTPFDTFEGQYLDTSWADQKTSYSITSSSDTHYQKVTHPLAVYRKHAPTGIARVDDWKFSSPIEYHIYLVLPYPLQDRADYTISFEGDTFPKQKLTFDPIKNQSFAIHISQIGFHPDELSCVKYFVGRENPTRDEMYPLESGHFDEQRNPVLNPYYDPAGFTPTSISINYSSLGWIQNETYPQGMPFFEVPADDDYILAGTGPDMGGQRFFSRALTRALLDNGVFTLDTWPDDLAKPDQTDSLWLLLHRRKKMRYILRY
jgi:hypothetical protein